MILSNIIEGLTILKSYFDEDGYDTGAEHDQFYVYATDRPLSDAHLATLIELGWFQPDSAEDAPYDPEGGWSFFT